jgi:hypothetical protein
MSDPSIPIMAFVFLIAVALVLGKTSAFPAANVNASNDFSSRRYLRDGDGGAGPADSTEGSARAKYSAKKSEAKAERMKRILGVINSKPHIVGQLQPEAWGAKHNPSGPAIFSVALNYGSALSEKYDAQIFVGTARHAGFTGDIVLGMSPGYTGGFLEAVKKSNSVVYTIETVCGVENQHDELCAFKSRPDVKASVNMIRFFLYQFWASQYDENAMIMVADFADVFFQSNPFTFDTHLWMPPVAQLVVFQEAYPNKILGKCPFNSGWVSNCYGEETLQKIGTNTVSCSGVTIGTRDAMIVYSYMISQQLDPKIRYGKDTTKTNKGCISTGMDQGFHNWLVYSGILDRYMDVKIFQQGQGPVNTLGAFYPGEMATLKFDLKTWKVLRGEGKNKYISNWDGKPSPVVHQFDRFKDTDLAPNLKANIASLQTLDM